MSYKELRRAGVLERVKSGELKLGNAAVMMGLSYRQSKRLAKRYREEGAQGLKHGSAGQESNRKKPRKFRERVLRLVGKKYSGEEGERFGPTLAAEHLASDDHVEVNAQTLRNTRPLDSDLLALFCDGKYVEVRDGDRLKPACIYLVVGLGRDGKKRVLACLAKSGRENLEDWKLVLRSLLERGLRRVLIVVQDDFSGLLPISKSLFPTADVQLCVVHMQRNAKNHLSKADSAEFQQRWRALRDTWDEPIGITQFEDLCQRFDHDYPAFMTELRKKRDHYLAFLKYPDAIRRSLSTTNVVEAVNGQLEIIRRNSGGYFQSQDTVKLKLGITITSLENGRWAKVPGRVETCLHQLIAQFQTRFESES